MTVNDAYVNLQAAIIEQAVEDYERAIFCNDKREIASLKRWFKSEWCSHLTFGNGEVIEERVRIYEKSM